MFATEVEDDGGQQKQNADDAEESGEYHLNSGLMIFQEADNCFRWCFFLRRAKLLGLLFRGYVDRLQIARRSEIIQSPFGIHLHLGKGHSIALPPIPIKDFIIVEESVRFTDVEDKFGPKGFSGGSRKETMDGIQLF